ncbi:MAG: tetratricopeptide repeat protein [Deltaproteobacteria bacterium]|nr:tetratricopeptide repeat protein [Deltaproteobacteria bacterium]
MGLVQQPYSRASELADLAERLRRQGRLADAMENIARVLAEEPEHARTQLIRARILYQQGRLPEALEGLRNLESVGSQWGIRSLVKDLEQLRRRQETQMDTAFATEAMAALLSQQGYLFEALEIYRRLFLRSEEKQPLLREILVLRERMKQAGSRGIEKQKLDQELKTLDRWLETTAKRTLDGEKEENSGFARS